MATIRDVAKKSGVSPASVSRILNNDPTYKATDETKNRVFNAAFELNYSIDKNYSRRKTVKAKNTIGFLTDLTSNKLVDSYFSNITNGIQQYLMRFNYEMKFFQSLHDTSEEDYVNNIFKPNVKGLIILSAPSQSLLKKMLNKNQNIVGVDSKLENITTVKYNRFEAGCKAMQYLIDKGHKKIAFIGYIENGYTTYFGRYDAYQMMLKRYGLEFNPEWVIDTKWNRQICFEKTQKLMGLDNKPTAFFVASDYMAIASMSAVFQMGLSVPNDISIIGISDIEEAKYATPSLTTIAVPQKEMGEMAANITIAKIKGEFPCNVHIDMPLKIIERDTVKDINGI